MVKIPKRPTEEELGTIALCLSQGYTGIIIKFINSNNLDNQYHIRQVLSRSVKHCIIEYNNGYLLDTVETTNRTITNILKHYKDRL